MFAEISEWLNLIVRWVHVIAAIMWIGSSIFFHWLDRSFVRPEQEKKGVEGELWMVHGGGFYQVEKKLVAPEALPKQLHWFKWEAGFTWLSGMLLLSIVYYLGGGMLMVDPSVSGLSAGASIHIGIVTLIASWAIYDVLWQTVGKKNAGVATAISVVFGLAAVFLLTRTMSGRAAYIHTGAMLGTIMVGNVWMRIIPAQRALVEATKAGTKPDPDKAKAAKRRSTHNHYMTYPVVFIMISNHFPSVYGGGSTWFFLAAATLLGAGVKHWMNVVRPGPKWLLGFLGAIAAVTMVSIAVPTRKTETLEGPVAEVAPSPKEAVSASSKTKLDPATAGKIRGSVQLQGTPPPPPASVMTSDCQAHAGQAPASALPVSVKDGKLANTFLWIKSGFEGLEIPPAPKDEVVVDQQGCVYVPRVVGVRAKQPVAFLNSDPLLHNVRAVAEKNQTFSLAMPTKNLKLTRTFNKPEIMVQARCDVHPWMAGFIGVVPHPWFAVSNAEGEYVFENVPPGKYVVEAWHEVFGTQTQEITVGPTSTATAAFTFEVK